MNLKDLKKPFAAEDIEWRIQSSGKGDKGIWAKCLAYVTNRAIMERLDEVLGPQNWKNEFTAAPDGGVLCGISIKIGDEWITKYDGAENTNIEATKGGLSGAMKRAAVQWGIGRYLYKLDVAWANVNTDGDHSSQLKDKSWFKWDAPMLPNWALPEGEKPKPPKEPAPKYLTFKELSDKVGEAKAIPHLQNVWTKYAKDIAALPKDQQELLTFAKDAKKEFLKEDK